MRPKLSVAGKTARANLRNFLRHKNVMMNVMAQPSTWSTLIVGVSGASGFATCHSNMGPPFACEIVSVNSLLADIASVFGKLSCKGGVGRSRNTTMAFNTDGGPPSEDTRSGLVQAFSTILTICSWVIPLGQFRGAATGAVALEGC